MTYEEVLALIPNGISVPQVGESSRLGIPDSPKRFVAPPLTSGHTEDLEQCQIVIFSAAGAVGKSTLATKIAADSKTPLWNLATTKLGDNSFTGTLVNAYEEGYAKVLSSLSNGTASLILDGLDEVEAGSGWDALESFLREVASKIINADRPAILLFSRIPTADVAQLILQDAGLRVGQVSIDYFDREAAISLIERQLDERGVLQHREQDASFKSLVSHIFREISESISPDGLRGEDWEHPQVRSFLGYAPVLEAISALIATISNYGDRPRLNTGGADASVIGKIMSALLERESGKLVASLRSTGIIHPDQAFELYSPLEQMRLICAHLFFGGVDTIDVPLGLRPEQIQDYRTARREFLPNHPFLHSNGFSGTAFRDYTLAYMLFGSTHEERKASDLIEADTFRLTSLFLDFYLERARHVSDDGKLLATSLSHLGYLWESDRAALGAGENVGQSLETLDGGETVWVSGRTNESVRFDRGDALVRLPFSFSNSTIDISEGLSLGQRGRPIRITDSFIECESLSLECSQLELESTKGRDGVQIVIRQSPHVPSAFKFQRYENGEPISLEWPGASAWPFNGKEPVAEEAGGDQVDVILQILYRFVSVFRADHYGREYRKLADLIRNRKASTPLAKRVLQDLEETHFLKVKGIFYEIDPSDLAKHEMTWSNIRQGIYPEPARKFAAEISARIGQ